MLSPIIEFDYWGLPIYNIMGIIGFICAVLLILKKEKMLGLDVIYEEKVNSIFLVSSLSSLVFANIANWFLFPEILSLPLMQRFYLGGFSFYYGMLGFFAVATLLLWFSKIDIKYWINEIVPSVLIFHAFGRIGCSLAGCCYGVDIEPINLFGLTIHHFPAREIESLCLFILFFIFRYGIKKNRFFWYLSSYSILRFTLEFGRGDDRGHLFFDTLSPAQVTSIFIWIALFGWTVYKIIRNRSFHKGELDSEKDSSRDTENRPVIHESHSTQNSTPKKKKNIFKRLFILFIIFGIFSWWNPFNLNLLTDLNFTVLEFVSQFSKEKSVVGQISESNGTEVFVVESKEVINSGQNAVNLINSLDSDLNGEFTFNNSLKLPNSNSLYIFNQVHKGIPIYNAGKQLVLNKDNIPLYSVGETSVAISNAIVPETMISDEQAVSAIQQYVADDTIEFISAEKYWYYQEYSSDNAYKLVYVIDAVFKDSDHSVEFSAVVDALSSEVYDINVSNGMTTESYMSGDIQKAYIAAINLLAHDYVEIIKQVESGKLTADNEYGFYFTKSNSLKNYYTGFEQDGNVQIINRAFAEIMKSKHFTKDDLTAILNSSYEVAINSSSLNYWLLRSIIAEECSSYYSNKGASSGDIKKQVKVIENAFDIVGITSKNKSQGVVQLEMKDSFATTKGKIAYPGDLNVITVTQKAGMAQSYEIKSDVPVSINVVNSRNESILTLPVYDAESFKINPTDTDEKYTIFVQSGSVFYGVKETKTANSPFALTVYAADITEDMVANALVDAYYSLVVKPIESNISENKEVTDALKRITQAYKSENLNLFLALIDPKSEDWVEGYAQIQGMLITAKALNSCAKSLTTSLFGEDISFDSIDRAIIAGALVFGDFSDETMWKSLKLKDTSLRLNCYETESFENRTIAHLSASIINDNTGEIMYNNESLYLSLVQRNRIDVSSVIDVPVIGGIADSATKGWFIENVSPEALKQYGWDNNGNLNMPELPFVEITTPFIRPATDAVFVRAHSDGMSSAGVYASIAIDASDNWEISTEVDWINISKNDKELSIYAKVNPSDSSRTAIISLWLTEHRGVAAIVKVTQFGSEVDTQLLASFSNAAYRDELYDAYDNKPKKLDGLPVSIKDYDGWKLVHVNRKTNLFVVPNGFWYMIFEKGKDIVIAFRGTPPPNQPSELGDWVRTLEMIASGVHEQDINVKREFEKDDVAKYLKDRNVYITGHSLGGHLAVTAYAVISNLGHENSVKRVETFNAVGEHRALANIADNTGYRKIIQHYTCCDIAAWGSQMTGLAFAGSERPLVTITQDHIHSTERGKASWWDWCILSYSYWVYELIVDPASTGIDAHGLKHFNPIDVKAEKTQSAP